MKRLNFKQLAPQLSDEDLLISLSEGGEEEALKVLYQRHSGKVLGYCLKKGFPKEAAEEIVQIVFMQIWKKRTLYSPQYKALAWLFVLTKSEAKDYRNREKTQLKVKTAWNQEKMLFVSQNDLHSPIHQEQELSLKGLTTLQREALEKRYYEEQEFSEIAKALGKSESNIRKIISRALQILRLQNPISKEMALEHQNAREEGSR